MRGGPDRAAQWTELRVGRTSIGQLRAAGVSDEDIRLAQQTQKHQRAAGRPVLPLSVICGLSTPKSARSAEVVEITPRQLRKRGALGQAALIADQVALTEKSPERAQKARLAGQILKDLARPHQIEFDFFGGNMSIAHQYQDAVTERLFAAASTTTKAKEAQAILWQITRYLAWQSYECTKTAADLCEITRTDKSHMARALDLLEQVGAIRRVKRGRTKVITVTPEGAYRGDVNQHAAAVQRYKLEVIEGGRSDV